jgi:hypothetical protein
MLEQDFLYKIDTSRCARLAPNPAEEQSVPPPLYAGGFHVLASGALRGMPRRGDKLPRGADDPLRAPHPGVHVQFVWKQSRDALVALSKPV